MALRSVLRASFLSKVAFPSQPDASSLPNLCHFSASKCFSTSFLFRLSNYHSRRLSTSAAPTSQDPISQSSADDNRIPVTIITGFLGAGKTTLLNHVLKANHGKRLAIIENEFGEVDIDGSLVAAQKAGQEDIMMLSNGCLCCTVRGDLVRMIAELVSTKKNLFDHILIETTGLANPAPIIETFYMEQKIAGEVRLDGVLTLVDAKHAQQHLDEKKPEGVVNEAVQQIAYADRILLNKVDLVKAEDLQLVTQRIKGINGIARIKETKYGQVDMDYVLGIGGFDIERIDKEMEINISKEHKHGHTHGHDHVCDSTCDHTHHTSHQHHDSGVGSVSIVCEGTLDLDKINQWLGTLLSQNADEIYRCKGVLSIDGTDSRYVFQAVHALYEGGPDRVWGHEEKRVNKLVFIGKKLDKEALEKGFKECLLQSG